MGRCVHRGHKGRKVLRRSRHLAQRKGEGDLIIQSTRPVEMNWPFWILSHLLLV
jgi:hypothetical protein